VSNPFVAEVRIVGFNFPPTGWAYCNGQLLPISQNTALFSLVGTFYGGDGKTTFALPNMQGNVAISSGQGPGLSDRFLGEESGTSAVTLLQSEIPAHNHQVACNIALATVGTGATNSTFARASGGNPYKAGTPNIALDPATLGISGGSLPHNNMMPYLTLNYIIALQGVFPARN
jgi:microcystin-dependent protein